MGQDLRQAAFQAAAIQLARIGEHEFDGVGAIAGKNVVDGGKGYDLHASTCTSADPQAYHFEGQVGKVRELDDVQQWGLIRRVYYTEIDIKN